jgi:hypothetical protein
MRFFRGFAREKDLPIGPAPAAPLGVAAWASCAVWLIGTLKKNSAWVSGGLTRSEAHSLDKAILVIGLPPIFFFIGIAYFVYRRRQVWRGEAEAKAASHSDSAAS